MTRSNITRLMTGTLVALTTFQGMLPQFFPIVTQQAISSAIVMFLVVFITAWKQFLSVEINDAKAKWPTLIVAVVATLGGLNDLFNVIIFTPHINQILRLSLTLFITVLAVLSKTFWPAPEAAQIEKLKSDLVITQKNLK